MQSYATTIACDVGNEESCRLMIEEVIKKFGRIDVLINNAGISRGFPESSITTSIEDIQTVFETYFKRIDSRKSFWKQYLLTLKS